MKLEEVEIIESPVMDMKEALFQPDTSEEEEIDDFSFSKFASLHFQGSSTPSHIQQRLRQPLLYHEDEGDALVTVLPINSSIFLFSLKALFLSYISNLTLFLFLSRHV